MDKKQCPKSLKEKYNKNTKNPLFHFILEYDFNI